MKKIASEDVVVGGVVIYFTTLNYVCHLVISCFYLVCRCVTTTFTTFTTDKL